MFLTLNEFKQYEDKEYATIMHGEKAFALKVKATVKFLNIYDLSVESDSLLKLARHCALAFGCHIPVYKKEGYTPLINLRLARAVGKTSKEFLADGLYEFVVKASICRISDKEYLNLTAHSEKLLKKPVLEAYAEEYLDVFLTSLAAQQQAATPVVSTPV